MSFSFKLLPFSFPFSLWPLLGIITGIFFLQFSPLVVAGLTVFIFLILILLKKSSSFYLTLLFFSGFLLGATRMALLKRDYANSVFSLEQDPLQIKEIIKTGNIHWPYRATLKKMSAPYVSFFVFCKKTLEVQIDDLIKCPNLSLKQPKDPDFLRYLFKEGVVGTVFVKEFQSTLVSRPNYSFARWGHNKRTTLLLSLKKKLSRPSFSFFCSLFIGDKKQINYLTEKYKPLFKQWGISHHMARSGLHLIIFIILWQLLLSMLPFSFLQKHSFLFLLCLFYFFLTPASISFIRAFFLFLLYKICVFNSWQIHGVHLICLVAFAALLHNPFQLFFLDFQLSFFLTFCLSWLSHLNGQKQAYF
jgi:ComEC/Rec2-related protein